MYVVCCDAAVAQDAWRVSVLEKYWCMWHKVLQSRHAEKDKDQKADKLAQHGSQRLVLAHWKQCIFAYFTLLYVLLVDYQLFNAFLCHADIRLCSEKAKKEKAAMQHRHISLLVSGKLYVRSINMFVVVYLAYNYDHLCVYLQRLGLKSLALNVTQSKTHRLNKNISVQHHRHIVRA